MGIYAGSHGAVFQSATPRAFRSRHMDYNRLGCYWATRVPSSEAPIRRFLRSKNRTRYSRVERKTFNAPLEVSEKLPSLLRTSEERPRSKRTMREAKAFKLRDNGGVSGGNFPTAPDQRGARISRTKTNPSSGTKTAHFGFEQLDRPIASLCFFMSFIRSIRTGVIFSRAPYFDVDGSPLPASTQRTPPYPGKFSKKNRIVFSPMTWRISLSLRPAASRRSVRTAYSEASKVVVTVPS
jgi:hypothetical protein